VVESSGSIGGYEGNGEIKRLDSDESKTTASSLLTL
jgi:hypothetical protein